MRKASRSPQSLRTEDLRPQAAARAPLQRLQALDGAAEREEMPFSTVTPALRHEASIGGWAEGNPWDFPVMPAVDTPRRPDS
jgi:hypothetical protein